MMIQRRRHRSPSVPDRTAGQHAADASFQHELLAQIAAGNREFALGDDHSATGLETFRKTVRALESLAALGLITIGRREMAADAPGTVIAIRRIRLTEAGKRRTAPIRSSDRPRDPEEPNG